MERGYQAVVDASGGAMFTFSQNPSPFDHLSGPEALARLQALVPHTLGDQQRLSEVLSREEPPQKGAGKALEMDSLTDAHIRALIE